MFSAGVMIGIGWPELFALLVAIGLAFIPAFIAKKKGYSSVGFYFFGLFLFIPALIVALVIRDKNEEQQRFVSNAASPTPYSNQQGVPVGYVPDAPSVGFAFLGFFFPLVGLILFLVWKDQFPLKAKSCGKGALIALIVGGSITLLTIIALVIVFLVVGYSFI